MVELPGRRKENGVGFTALRVEMNTMQHLRYRSCRHASLTPWHWVPGDFELAAVRREFERNEELIEAEARLVEAELRASDSKTPSSRSARPSLQADVFSLASAQAVRPPRKGREGEDAGARG